MARAAAHGQNGGMRRIVVIDAPSNLGLRPPVEGAVPGCYKLAGALREQRLVQRLGAYEGGNRRAAPLRPRWLE